MRLQPDYILQGTDFPFLRFAFLHRLHLISHADFVDVCLQFLSFSVLWSLLRFSLSGYFLPSPLLLWLCFSQQIPFLISLSCGFDCLLRSEFDCDSSLSLYSAGQRRGENEEQSRREKRNDKWRVEKWKKRKKKKDRGTVRRNRMEKWEKGQQKRERRRGTEKGWKMEQKERERKQGRKGNRSKKREEEESSNTACITALAQITRDMTNRELKTCFRRARNNFFARCFTASTFTLSHLDFSKTETMKWEAWNESVVEIKINSHEWRAIFPCFLRMEEEEDPEGREGARKRRQGNKLR